MCGVCFYLDKEDKFLYAYITYTLIVALCPSLVLIVRFANRRCLKNAKV